MKFPIDLIIPQLRKALLESNNVVLTAEPGAGKTTRVPIALLQDEWLREKKIIMLEPRRLAAQRAASFMAEQLHEQVGMTIGYTMRGERKIGPQTMIEVVTEGILTRMLQDDPELRGVGLLIFDEFHERSIHADLGLALALDVQHHLRPDMKLLVMSATLDDQRISHLLGKAPVISGEGRMFPVEVRYLSGTIEGNIEPVVVSTIMKSLRADAGDLLVFLPGQREIRRVESLLTRQTLQENVHLHTLFGEASPKQQQEALSPAPPNERKIILSTSIAETSLTIDGVRVVIDSGLSRISRFDPRRGMSGLVTTAVSQANAEQRKGRAGRQYPGVCYRLWSEQQHKELPKFLPPEILSADLAPLALELARWGAPDGKSLLFLDSPPEHHLAQAQSLLQELGALDLKGSLTSHGKIMAAIPAHPRLSHMIIRGKELHLGSLACDIAALLEERDLLRGESDGDIDLFSRWYVLRKQRGKEGYALDRVKKQASRLRQVIGAGEGKQDKEKLGILLALAYPERVGKRREGSAERYQLSGGAGAILPKSSLLARSEYLAIGDVDGTGSEVKIFLASPISEAEIRLAFPDRLTQNEEVRWDEREQKIVARAITRFGSIELSESTFLPPDDLLQKTMIEGIRLMGLDSLPWTKESLSIKERSEWLRRKGLVQQDWVILDSERLLETLDKWLGPFLTGITRKSHLQRLNMSEIIRAMFSYHQLKELDELTPTHIVVQTGSRIPLDYSNSDQPILAVRLQEMFGETETPTVARGKVKVLLHLLSPAHRPIAVTQDLPSFWKNAYPDVRKDMRGRYPKHYWPENPLEAEPTRRAKPRK